MKTCKTRNLVLALVGLLALSIYILACTSFSPDDTKVLYPAFDAGSGAIGMAVYDREARHSAMLFLAITYEGGQSNRVTGSLVRGQWLADGRNILIAWVGGKASEESVNLALVPWGGRGPFNVFRLPGKEAEGILMAPLCVAGERVFVIEGPGEVLRIDLRNGARVMHEFKDVKHGIELLPAPDGAGVFYVESREEPDTGVVFGRLNPDDFSRTQLMVITNEMAAGSFFSCDKAGKQVAFLEKSSDPRRLVVLREGKPSFTRTLGAEANDLGLGNVGFSPKGDWLWATFQKPTEGKDRCAYGFLEIPFSEAPVRQTILIPSAPLEKGAALDFQGAVSHDGKTAAVASTYLACGDAALKPEDCALFLIDLGSPGREVTRVPIPVPAERPVFK